MTIWKPLKITEGKYEVSSCGKVRNAKTKHILKPFDNGGYDRVNLNGYGKHLIHRLVAYEFIPNPENLPQVNHKDLDKRNNDVSNLEWSNGSDNVRHYVELEGRKRLSKSMSSIGKEYGHIGVEASKKPVAMIDIETGETVGIYESAREASRITGASYKHISAVCRGKRKTHYGYEWAFVKSVTTIESA